MQRAQLLAPGRTALQAWHSHLTLKLAQTLLSGLAQVFFAFNGKVEGLSRAILAGGGQSGSRLTAYTQT